MLKVLVGIASFLAVGYLAVTVIYPWVFTTISGLFENNDLGVIVALAVCALITFPLIWLVALFVGLVVILTGAGQEEVKFARLRRENARKWNRK